MTPKHRTAWMKRAGIPVLVQRIMVRHRCQGCCKSGCAAAAADVGAAALAMLGQHTVPTLQRALPLLLAPNLQALQVAGYEWMVVRPLDRAIAHAQDYKINLQPECICA